MRILLVFSACGLLLSSPTMAAGDWDAADDIALQETQNMMLNPALRAAAIQGDAKALQASDQAKAAVGRDGKKEAESYALGMELFTKIAKEEGGDLDKIQGRLEAYQKNPDSLGTMMTDAQKAQLRQIASEAKK